MPAIDAPPLLPEDPAAFGMLIEPHRAELVVHCYRMLGSLDDAEDAVQDALVRAWNGRASFVRSGSLRAWLYRIATTASLDALARRSRRRRETSLDVEPAPDAWLAGAAVGPEARYELRESVSLAFLRALQLLPARQRAALILRDVLGWRIEEIADLLETSVAAVNSALQRARATVDATRPMVSSASTSPDRSLADRLDRFVRAWEAADVDGLVGLLRADASLRMPPRPDVTGADAIAAFIVREILVPGGPNRLVPARANGGSAFVVVGPPVVGGEPRPFAVIVPQPDDRTLGFASIDATARPSTVQRFAAAAGLARPS